MYKSFVNDMTSFLPSEPKRKAEDQVPHPEPPTRRQRLDDVPLNVLMKISGMIHRIKTISGSSDNVFILRIENIFQHVLDSDRKSEGLQNMASVLQEQLQLSSLAANLRAHLQDLLDEIRSHLNGKSSSSPSSSMTFTMTLPSSMPSSPTTGSSSSVPIANSESSGAETDTTVVGQPSVRRSNRVQLIIGREYDVTIAEGLDFEHLPFKIRKRASYKLLYDKTNRRKLTKRMVLQSFGEVLIVFSDGSINSPTKEYRRSDIDMKLVSAAVSEPDKLLHGMIIEVKYDQDPTWYPLRYSATLDGKTYVVEDKPPLELSDSETYDFDESNANFNEAWRFPKYVELQAGDEVEVYFAYDYRQVPENAKLSGWQVVEITEDGDSDHEFIAECKPKKPGPRQNSELTLDLWYRRVRIPGSEEQVEDYDQEDEEEDELEDRVLDEGDRVVYEGRNYIVDSVSMGEDDIVYVLRSSDPELDDVTISQEDWLTRWSPEFEKGTRVLYMGRAAIIIDILYSEKKYKIEDSKDDEVIVDESSVDVYTDLTYDEGTIVVMGFKKWKIESRDDVNMIYHLVSEDGTSRHGVTESELEEWCLVVSSNTERIGRIVEKLKKTVKRKANSVQQLYFKIQFEDGSIKTLSVDGAKSNVRDQSDVNAYFETKASRLLDDEDVDITRELPAGTSVIVFGRDGAAPLSKSDNDAAGRDYDSHGKIVRSLPGENMVYDIELDDGRIVTLTPEEFGVDEDIEEDSQEVVLEQESSSDDSSDDSDDPMAMTDDEDQDFAEGSFVYLDDSETVYEIVDQTSATTFTLRSKNDASVIVSDVEVSRLTLWSPDLEEGDTVVVNGDWSQPVKIKELDDDVAELSDGRKVSLEALTKYTEPLKKGTLATKAGSKTVYKVLAFANGQYTLQDAFTGERSVAYIDDVDEKEEPDFNKGDFVVFNGDIREVKTVMAKKGAYKLSDDRIVQEKDLTEAPDPKFGRENDEGKWVGDKDQLVYLNDHMDNIFKIKKILRETRQYVIKRTGRTDRDKLVPFEIGTVVRNSSERMLYKVIAFDGFTYTLEDINSGQTHTADIEEIDVAIVSEDTIEELTENDLDEEDL